MRTLTFRRPTAVFALAATLLAAFVFLFAWPQPAAAHDVLVESSPSADSTVDTLPAELTLTFSAGLISGEGSTEIVVTDAAGESVTDGPAELDGAMITQPLRAEAAEGEYHVLWKVVSSDGHPTSGEFSFAVATSTLASPDPEVTPTADATVAPAPDQTQAADDPSPETQSSSSPGWLIGGAVAALIVVVVLVLLLRRRKPTEPESDAPAER